jgi:hypothetical protein
MGDIALCSVNKPKVNSRAEDQEHANAASGLGINLLSIKVGILVKSGKFSRDRSKLKKALSLANSWHSIEITACVAGTRTTWNEVIKPAKMIIDEARGKLSPEKAHLSIARRESLDINEIVQSYMERPHLAIRPPNH